MEKKYQTRKAKLKHALVENPVRDVLVVDDAVIRRKYFAEAINIINKIESLEAKIQLFHSSDQIRFDAWYGLTFQEDLLSVDRTQEQLKKLIQFHNWVVAAARMLKIELPEALILMQEEEHLYHHGNQEERDKIEQKRKLRNEFIDGDSNARYDEEAAFHSKNSDPEARALDAIFERLEGILLGIDYEILSRQEDRLDRLIEIEAEVMTAALADSETAFLLFHLGINWGDRNSDYTFFLKIWRLFANDQKDYFADVYESISGQPIQILLMRIGKKSDLNFLHDEQDKEHEDLENENQDDEEEETFRLNDEFFEKKRFANKTKLDPLQQENFKQLYRKLVRKLHPDTQGDQKSQSWMKRFWQLVQDAYKAKDAVSLDRLFKLTLLRTNSLNQLTFDEIGQAKGWLKQDLSFLKTEQGQLKKSLAWGFTGLKDFTTLSRKIRNELEQARNSTLNEIQKIKKQHQILNGMALNADFEQARSQRKKVRKNKNRNRQKRNRFKTNDHAR